MAHLKSAGPRHHDNDSASSSSASYPASTSHCHNDYDIFINHRGPDVKNTFASHLYCRLRSGMRVFLDKPELEVGHDITPQILHAIETASIHIAIFSSTYAESKWCLDELVHMLKSCKSNQGTIIPVFYGVKPSDLRWTAKGAYAEALHNHETKQRYDTQIIQGWKSALRDVAEISGLELDAFNGDEGQLLDALERRVLKIVDKAPLYVAEHPTGLKEKLQEFENTVLCHHEHSLKARVVGIVGLGGVGKTTLAKEFFNSKRSDYNGASFLFDLRENDAKGSLSSLQRSLVKDLTQKDVQINSTDEGIEKLRKLLSSCHALIILDDVNHSSQLEAFLPIKDILSSNSLILVTSRDKQVLQTVKIAEASIYKLTGLNRLHSQELFCSHAFPHLHSLPGFEGLVDRFLEACDGLPLSLKVFGALLYGKMDKSYWEELLNGLHKIVEIHERLKISFDSLNEEEQKIFLDIACFFIGEDRDKATRIWGLVGFSSLENKCLLEVDRQNNKIRMHDHLRDLGRSIIVGSTPRRLWSRTTNDIDGLLGQSSSVLSECRGITMVPPGGGPGPFVVNYSDQASLSSEMPSYKRWVREMFRNHNWKLHNNRSRGGRNLKFVAVQDGYLEDILRKVGSSDLTWLRWYKCPYSSLPSWIPMENLTVLEVAGSNLNELWRRESEAPIKLRELNVFASLSAFPKSIGQLKHLEKIVVQPLTAITLPEDFCDLLSLKYLELKKCSKMMSLPDSFGQLTNLQYIDLEGASSLQMLPNSFGNLTLLKHLSLRECYNLTISSETLGNITSLEYLDLSCCRNVKELPPQVAHQRSLEKLYLSSVDFRKLPSGIENLCNLECLELGSDSLEMLPPSVVHLKSLKSFSLSGCPKLNYLPQNLEILKLDKCLARELPFEIVEGEGGPPPLTMSTVKRALREEECWFRLKELQLYYTKILEVSFPHGVCPNLQRLCIDSCEDLLEVVELPATLLSLSMVYCPALREIGGLRSLAKLQRLHLHLINRELEELPSLEALISLEELEIFECENLQRIQGLRQLIKLRKLDVQSCSDIPELPGVEYLMSLEVLLVRNCPKLQWGGGVLEQLRQRLKEGFHVYANDRGRTRAATPTIKRRLTCFGAGDEREAPA